MRSFLPAPYGKNTPLSDGNKISDIEDIEMNIWSNGVGIKGKIDVALRTTKNRIIPLELKTGKSSFSIDHHAQVLMYSVLISELEDEKLDSGVLLYLKDGTETIVSPSVADLKGILQTRNGMARFSRALNIESFPVLLYLKDGTETIVTPSVADLKGILQTRNGMATFSRALNIESFPEPKLETRFCGKCQFSRHCTILQKVATTKSVKISEEMEKFSTNLTYHLSEKELAYGKQWIQWTFMEWKADRKRKNMEGIFMEKPQQRESHGTCLSNLVLERSERKEDGNIWMTFGRQNKEKLPSNVLEISELAVISTDEIVAIQTGVVVDRQETFITIKTDKEFSKRLTTIPSLFFHLDQYTSNASFPMQQNSIINLLEDSPEAKRLREFIIDLKEPIFGSLKKAEIEKIKPIVKKLSVTQAKAVIKALAAKDYLLIQGFPGSGKTSTIVGLVHCLVALGKTVLLTAYTNSAVDNMLLRLKEILPSEIILRIGGNYSTSRLEEIKPLLLETKLAEFKDKKTMLNQAKNMLLKTPIVATTCLTAGNHNFFTWRTKFDYCIVDEAALALQSSVIKPLLLGNVYVLVGDCRQLEPLVVCKEAKEQGMNISLMEKWEIIAEKVNGIVKLNQQYRMNSKICELSSEMFYDNLLQCATKDVANQTIEKFDEEMNEGKEEKVPRDLKNLILSSDISDSVIFIDTLSRSSDSNSFAQTTSSTSSKSNKGEVELISRLCQIYLSSGFPSSSIGIMSTYRNQVDELRKSLPSSIETNTVDQYQGRDKDIILISLVHTSISDLDYCNESLLSERRVNVALTRAKKKLILVGCLESLSTIPLMKNLIQKIENVYKFNG
uniref:DNA replication ATP-dependent helicase/nuclease n=1 Tax=Panagrolaimus sp. PS1159 TaxID=55785 RepID=A0AC35FII6_9BILA